MRIGAEPSGGTGGASGGMGALDIASAVAGLIPVLASLFGSLFGTKYQFTTGVRWLTAYYQRYVLGMNTTGTHTSSGLDEKYTPEAQAWFSAVLGVPIYDKFRLHALMGTRDSDGADLKWSDEKKVAAYLNPQWTDTQGQDPARVLRAVQIAKQFKWGVMPGTWAKYGIPADQPEQTSEQSGGGGLFDGTAGGSDNLMLWGGLALLGVAAWMYYEGDT